MGKRIVSLDLLRIFAAASVIAIHVFAPIAVTPEINLKWWVGNSILSITRSSIPIFIMLSGYFMLDKKSSKKVFFRKYTVKLINITILASLISLLFRVIYLKDVPSVEYYLEQIYIGQPYFHLYFLFIIIGLYLITPYLQIIINGISKNHYKKVTELCLIVLVLWFFCHTFITKKGEFEDLNIFNYFIPFTGYYLLGGYFKKNRKIVYYSNKALIISLVCITIVILLLDYALLKIYNGQRPYIVYPHSYLSPFIVIQVILLFQLFLNNNLNNIVNKYRKQISLISKYTLGIYIIHPLIQILLINLCLQILNFDFTSRLIHIILEYIFIVLLSLSSTHIFYKFIKPWSIKLFNHFEIL